MKRINKILTNPKYINYLNKNFESEKTRIFCHHDLRHAIDVSRVAYIMALEENLDIKKDIIYATGLIHDIGRWKEYLDGSDHAIISAELGLDILRDSGFDSNEEKLILSAIINHRKGSKQSTPLDRIIYNSDKISRPCNECLVIDKCKRFKSGETPKLHY